ncbi:DNA-directed DNA polymerase [Sporothrix curviconia]|uniref:DNA-directed DNA polymerase n=1 Tax=Sporothrix curviconia TaxID=1260050 RepID=A0ABP0B6V9_9PEZI
MGKRKRSGRGGNAPNNNNNANKRVRILDDDSDNEGPANGGAPVTFAPGESPEDKEALLANKALFSADLSRADHDRERRLYKLLGSADVEDRIRAADVIVSALLGASGSDEDEGGSEKKERESVSEAVLLRHLERRLLRGLASGSEASRVGFSYVLSELLGQLLGRRSDSSLSEDDGSTASATDYSSTYPNLTFDKLLDLLLDKTKPAANLPGQEERDHYWGQLFGLQSFVESGILFAASDQGRVSRWDTLLGHLLQLGHKKVWLRSQACFVVVQAIARGRLPDAATVAATLQKVASDTEGTGSSSSLAKTPEGLGMWLAAMARFPEMALPAPWTAPLAPGSHKDVVAVLKSGSIDDNEAKGVKQGNASAQLHFVWDLLLGALLAGKDAAEGDDAKRFDSFWVAVVDHVYFAKGASDHQKLTGFKVFQKALALCVATAASPETAIRPSLFSNNLMACLMNQASNPTPRLHRAAVSVLKAIERQVEENPRILVPVLACLLGSAPQAHGVYEFDERVKGTGDGTRPVERILRFADSESIEAVVRLLRTGALRAPDSNNDQKPFRIYAEYLFRLVSRAGADTTAATQAGEASVSSIAFQALAELSYPSATVAAPDAAANGEKSTKKKKSKTAAAVAASTAFPALNEKAKEASRKYLLSAAGALLKRPDDFAAFCRTVHSITPEAVGVAMTGEIEEHVLEAREQLKQLSASFDASAESAAKKEKSGAAAAARARQGLAVLLSVSLLQLYHEPRADAIMVLDDIKACGDKLTAALARSSKSKKDEKRDKKDKKDKMSKKSKKAVEEEEEEEEHDHGDHEGHEHGEPDIGQVLTEVLLSLLAESSQLTRQTSLQVFEAFTPFMSAEALDNLTVVLAAEENTSGYRALFNQEGEDEEEEEDDDDADSVEMVDGEDEDDDHDSVEMMDMDADGDVTALAGAVGSGDGDEEGSDDSDSDSGDDEDEDEEEDDEEDKEKEDEVNSLEAALMKTYKGSLLLDAKDGVKAKNGGDNDDDDDDSDNESDMSDDAMLALDAHLASHLKLIRNKTDSHKKERDEARKRVVGFKHRVLDLVETFVKNAPTSTGASLLLLFRLLLPLVVLIRDTKEPALAQKATRIVQEVPRQLKKSRSSTSTTTSIPVPLDEAIAILENLHEAANDKTENRAFATAVSTASVAIASALWTAAAATDEADGDDKSDDKPGDKDDRATVYRRVADVYRATQDRWVLDGWSVRTSLFTDWYNWCQNAARGA